MLQRKSSIYFRNIADKYIKIAVALFGLILLVGFLFLPLAVKIKKIECRTQFGICSSEIDAGIGSAIGKSYVFAKKDIKNKLKDTFLIKDFSIQLRLPNTVRIDLLIKKPSYCVYSKIIGSYFLIDDGGSVVSESKACSMPRVEYNEDLALNLGKTVGKQEMFYLNLIRGVYQMYQVDFGEIVDGSLTVDLGNGIRVIFPEEGEVGTLLGSLRLIVTKIKNDGLGYSEVDLRFANPVLR